MKFSRPSEESFIRSLYLHLKACLQLLSHLTVLFTREEGVNRNAADLIKIDIQSGEKHDIGHIWQNMGRFITPRIIAMHQ